jgi:threonine aldolase
MIKQRGGMLAKGRLLGIQFQTLLEDGLYEEIAGKAVKQAMHLKEAFLEKGYPLFYDSYTNQQFPIMPKVQLEQLKEKYSFETWVPLDDEYSAVRFCTSWATKDEDIEKLIADLNEL